MTDFIKSISAIILAIVVAINAFGNFIGVGDIIQTEPETSSVAEETMLRLSNAKTAPWLLWK